MRITPTDKTWVLIPARSPHLITVNPGTVFASTEDRATYTDHAAALAALASCPAPYPSWLLDPEAGAYVPPVPEPTSGDWRWDEAGQAWVEE